MNATEFLANMGVSFDWMEEMCSEIQSNNLEDADQITRLMCDMLEKNVPLPPKAAELTAMILKDLAEGRDARDRLGTKPGRGNPGNAAIDEKHRQADACLALLELAEIKQTKSACLVALAIPLSEREVWNLDRSLVRDGWNAAPYFAQIGFGKEGNGVLRRLLDHRPSGDADLVDCWGQFVEFCSVKGIR